MGILNFPIPSTPPHPGLLTISVDHTQSFSHLPVYENPAWPCCLGSTHVDSHQADYLRVTPGTGSAGSWPAMRAALVSPVLNLAWLKPGSWRWKALYLVISSLSHLVAAWLCKCDSVINSLNPIWFIGEIKFYTSTMMSVFPGSLKKTKQAQQQL